MADAARLGAESATAEAVAAGDVAQLAQIAAEAEAEELRQADAARRARPWWARFLWND